MKFEKITESDSNHRHLENKTVRELIELMNEEDRGVPAAVGNAIPAIEALIEAAADKLMSGGRLFYIGAGTSGRLGVLDASECPPTFGVPPGLVSGIIAGGQPALTSAVEKAEDDPDRGWQDLQEQGITARDFVIGLAASGTTPYVLGAIRHCRQAGIPTGSISCNPESPLSLEADFPVEAVTGPEFVTGSTRLKAGTAQKLILNMISTTLMIRLGRVEDNKMVHLQLTNEKLLERGEKMVMAGAGITDAGEARRLLALHGSVRNAIEAGKSQKKN